MSASSKRRRTTCSSARASGTLIVQSLSPTTSSASLSLAATALAFLAMPSMATSASTTCASVSATTSVSRTDVNLSRGTFVFTSTSPSPSTVTTTLLPRPCAFTTASPIQPPTTPMRTPVCSPIQWLTTLTPRSRGGTTMRSRPRTPYASSTTSMRRLAHLAMSRAPIPQQMITLPSLSRHWTTTSRTAMSLTTPCHISRAP
mmetsp:Transcript_18086/g.52746  ORF Transcript_18086/g.52746 Transcript_18086/m.52746 type:complete len:202 (-) Transcript_18086:799-1404(-)